MLPVDKEKIQTGIFFSLDFLLYIVRGIAVAHFGRRQVSSAEEGFQLPWNMRLALYIADEGGP